MPWARWGDPRPLPESARTLIAELFGVAAAPVPPVDPGTVPLPAGALPAAARADLAGAVGADNVRDDRAARLAHSAGRGTLDLLRQRAGGPDLAAPDAVVCPGSHDEVLEVLEVAGRHGIAVVPFGGGTSVVGGVHPGRAGFGSVISVDLRRMTRLVEVDPVSRTATFEPGARTPDAERALRPYGLTLGHVPQSFERATIGGYAATRSCGQASTGYGRFDDMVTALRVATPAGSLRLGDRAPGSAAGPDLRRVFLGSEGAFGLITEVTVRVRAVPPAVVDEAWWFPDFAAGTRALRALAQSAVRPALIRLSDATETAVTALLGAPPGGDAGGAGGCLALAGYEGEPERVAADRAAVASVLGAGGTRLPDGAAGDWRERRFAAPYLRDALLDIGVFAETLETATSWTNLERLDGAVRDALAGALGDAPAGGSGDSGSPGGSGGSGGSGPVVMCHVSHTYETGASLYYTVVMAAGADPVTRWTTAKRAATSAIAAAGGTITHHHGVGLDHRDWMRDEVGDLGVRILRAIKRTVDPFGVLNPDKLIPPDPADSPADSPAEAGAGRTGASGAGRDRAG